MLKTATTPKALLDALTAVRGAWDTANNRPADWGAAILRPSARGGTVQLAPGTYKLVAPLTCWGALTLRGNGPDTVLDARGIPANRAAIELAGTPIDPGSGWCGNVRIEHLTILSTGAGVGISPDHPVTQLLGLRLRDLAMYCQGWGVDVSAAYAQECVIEDVQQADPGSGGLALRGNLNTVRRYSLVNGHAAMGFRSPWLDGRGQVDVGGAGNLVEQCHVEHTLPARADGTVDPKDAVVPFVHPRNRKRPRRSDMRFV